MKKWLIRLGLISVLTFSLVAPAAAGNITPDTCGRTHPCDEEY
ncbi:hypothetical protein [Bacillus mesophilum]|nr:hypothetical protein [Bacillus mesophilum]